MYKFLIGIIVCIVIAGCNWNKSPNLSTFQGTWRLEIIEADNDGAGIWELDPLNNIAAGLSVYDGKHHMALLMIPKPEFVRYQDSVDGYIGQCGLNRIKYSVAPEFEYFAKYVVSGNFMQHQVLSGYSTHGRREYDYEFEFDYDTLYMFRMRNEMRDGSRQKWVRADDWDFNAD